MIDSAPLDSAPLADRLHRESSGWTLAKDDDDGVCLMHKSGFWCRFGPETWARFHGADERAIAHIVRLLIVAVERAEVGRHALVGYTAGPHGASGAWRPEVSTITLEKRT